jgi:NADH dehydrogenase
LLEAADKLVANMPDRVRLYTLGKLRKMGVEVRLGSMVAQVSQDTVILKGNDNILANTVVWTAGVRGEPLAGVSGILVTKDGRVAVSDTLQVREHPEIYVIGDLASINEGARILPMVAQVAIQSGISTAQNILRQVEGQEPKPFKYHDRGSMITIGRKAAGVAIGSLTFTGFIAWVMWLVIHLFNLIGFRNRVMVLTNWAWDYLLYERAVRFVFPSEMPSVPQASSCTAKNKNGQSSPGSAQR